MIYVVVVFCSFGESIILLNYLKTKSDYKMPLSSMNSCYLYIDKTTTKMINLLTFFNTAVITLYLSSILFVKSVMKQCYHNVIKVYESNLT